MAAFRGIAQEREVLTNGGSGVTSSNGYIAPLSPFSLCESPGILDARMRPRMLSHANDVGAEAPGQ